MAKEKKILKDFQEAEKKKIAAVEAAEAKKIAALEEIRKVAKAKADAAVEEACEGQLICTKRFLGF